MTEATDSVGGHKCDNPFMPTLAADLEHVRLAHRAGQVEQVIAEFPGQLRQLRTHLPTATSAIDTPLNPNSRSG